jgi:uncharacterized protein with beta-barrel porin domain
MSRTLASRIAVGAVALMALGVTLEAQAQCVTNSQTINQTGPGVVIAVNQTGCFINSGSVTATSTGGGGATAINITGGGSVTNSGSAAATSNGIGSHAFTILVVGGGSITNSGTATATAADTGGISVALGLIGNGTIINSGTAFGTAGAGGAQSAAIAINGSGTVVNTGSAFAVGGISAANNVGIQITGANSTLINAGSIVAPGGEAIQLAFVGGDTLTLLAGSFIVGTINFAGTGNTLNVNVGNQNLTFNTLTGVTVAGSVPFVAVGNQVASIDPTPFGLADKNLMDFTRGISGVLDQMGGSGAPSGPMSSAFAPSAPDSMAARVEQTFAAIPALAYASDQALVFKAPSMVASDGRAIWARGFGGERNQDPDNGLLGAHTSFFGGAVGFDILARPDLRLGLFAGGGESRMSLDGNAGFTNTSTAFGGLDGRWGFVSFGRASFLDFALHGGGSTNATSRTVNNNAIAGGIEIATASYSSSYISPELKYGINIPLWAQYTLTPSVRVRYVAGFFGGYTETGTTAPLTVASRTTQDFEERGELKLTRATPVGRDLLLTSVNVGIIGLERVGGTTVNTVLLGAGLPFVTPGRNDTAGIVGGAGIEWRTREGISIFGAGEAIGFSDQSTVWAAKGGFRVAF